MENKARFVGAEGRDKKVLDDGFFRVGITTANQVGLPDDSIMTKIMISGRKGERFSIDIEKGQEVLKAVKGIELLAGFERQ